MTEITTVLNPVTTVTASGATQALSASTSLDATYDITLTANCALTLVAANSARLQTVTVILRQDATAGRVASLPTAFWPYGLSPTLNGTVGLIDVIQFTTVDGGASWFGSVVALSASGPSLMLNAPTGTIYAGASLTLTGQYLGTAPTGLDYQVDGGAWTTLPGSAVTIGNGLLSATITTPAAGSRQFAVRASGTSEVSNAAVATITAVSPPSSAVINGVAGNASVALTMSASANGSPITGFEVYRGISGGDGTYTKLTTVATTSPPVSGNTQATYTDATAANGTAYIYKTNALSAAGATMSSPSGAVTPTNVAQAPTHYMAVSNGKVANGSTIPLFGHNYLDARVTCALSDITGTNSLIEEWGTGQPTDSNFIFWMRSGKLGLVILTGGGTATYVDAQTTLQAALTAAGQTIPVTGITLRGRIDNDASGGAGTAGVTPKTAVFDYSLDGGQTWNAIGANGGVVAFSAADGVQPNRLSPDVGGGHAGNAVGKFYSASLNNGTTTYYNPNFTAQATGTTTFTDAAGLTWTLNGGGAIV